jgi:hypothetical protein
MTAMQWWRSWHGAPMDNKWLVISARSGVKAGIVSAVFWELCDFASQNGERGSIEGFDVEVYSIFSGFSEDEINAVIKALNDKEIIKDNKLVNWVKRQPQREDDSTDRVTKFRELKRSVTQCNAEISSDKDKDSDKDKKKNLPAKKPAGNLFQIAHALSSVTGLDYEKNKDRIYKIAKSFKQGEEQQIIREYGLGGIWYKTDWRGQKGQKPTLEQVVQTWNNLNTVIPDKRTELTQFEKNKQVHDEVERMLENGKS